jgi:hypothetical protein
MAEKVAKAGVKREKGWLYYLDKQGDVSRAKMARGGGKQKPSKPEKVSRTGVKRQEGYLYFIDKQGDVSRTRMARGGRAKKKAKSGSKRKKK